MLVFSRLVIATSRSRTFAHGLRRVDSLLVGAGKKVLRQEGSPRPRRYLIAYAMINYQK